VNDDTLLYWGMVVTMFILIAAMLTARELLEIYFERRRSGEDESHPGKTSGHA